MTITHLESAQRVVCEEQRRLRTEQEAFEEFHSKLETLTSSTPASASAPTQTQRHLSTLSTTAQLSTESNTVAVEESYRSTVMAVPHYTKDYGDTYWESICDEFGSEIATALKIESTVTPLLKKQLQQATQNATEERTQVLTILELEENALNESVETLSSVRKELTVICSRQFYECSAAELKRLQDDLSALESTCGTIGTTRQEMIRKQERMFVFDYDGPVLQTYLYEKLDVNYPVLSAVASLCSEVGVAERQIETSLAILNQ